MPAADQCNTPVVELAGRADQSIERFQSLDEAVPAGTQAVPVFLREATARNHLDLRDMSDEDQRIPPLTTATAAASGFAHGFGNVSQSAFDAMCRPTR